MANRTSGSSPLAPANRRIFKSFPMLASALALGGLVGCAPPPEGVEAIEQEGITFNGITFNGITFNGITFNGITFNGITFNGITFNGITFNGTPNPAFGDWFNNADGGDIAQHSLTMKYLIRCAVSAERTATYTDKNGVVHTWAGGLGLADSWVETAPTDEQKKWVSACLMAHVNSAAPLPKSIQVSLRGNAPTLGSNPLEMQAFTTFDGVFFGDLTTTPNKRYLCRPTWTPPVNYQNTLLSDWGRQCFFSADGCGGVFTMVDCNTACTPTSGEYSWGPTCTVDGETFPAINAYVPRFKKARDWQRSGVQQIGCASCLDGMYLDNFSSTSWAQVGGWILTGTNNQVMLDIRYNNATKAALKLRVLVNGVAVMNGSTANWDFAPTGAAWGVRSIPVTLPAGAMVKLQGPTSGKGPKVEVVSLRL